MELPTDSLYKTGPEQRAFFARVLERVGSLPDVTRAAVTSVLPLRSEDRRTEFLIENGPALAPNARLQCDLRQVSPGYFQTMGIPLKRGRLLDRHDSAEVAAPWVGVIDEAFARRYFNGENPLGRHLLFGQTHLEIVGVTGDVKHAGADREASPTLYLSFLQSPTARMNLVLRTTAAPASVVAGVKHAIWSIDRNQPIYRVESMEEVVAEAKSTPRLMLSLLGVFAGVALGLAAIGIYGVMAYAVSQRTNELGLRLALGASSADVVMLVLRQGLWLAVVGLSVGMAAVLILGRLVEAVFYHTNPRDPITLGTTAVLLGAVALTACLIPARRAAKVDPMVALRTE
jgi:putative ABC transport system permease protein